MSPTSIYNAHTAIYKDAIENFLVQYFESCTGRLTDAMKYSVLNGGKRLRGILCLCTCKTFCGDEWTKALPVAAGLECIHAMSLVHDDLPCMDDDVLRRGKPTCHVAFDEATALLAGDALLSEGVRLCATVKIPPEDVLLLIDNITEAIGKDGMTEGQMRDLEKSGLDCSIEFLEEMHNLKTGALLKASVISGAICGGANQTQLSALRVYAQNLGLAFQVVDDMLDATAQSDVLGKTPGKDEAQKKCTYARILGLESSGSLAEALLFEAKRNLEAADIEEKALFAIADWVLARRF